MSEQGTTKDQVSLDDLKWAVDAVPDQMPQLADYLGDEPSLYDNHFGAYQHARAEAWRTAFEWREGWYAKVLAVMHRASGDISIIEEGAEGMRLIREKLR